MPIILTCFTCKEPFSVSPSIARGVNGRAPARYCSHRCRSADPAFQRRLSANKIGPNAPKLPIDGTIEDLWNGGLNCTAIARRYGCNPESVRLFLRRRGIQPRRDSAPKHRWRLDPAPTEDIAHLYTLGLSMVEIGRRYGVSKSAIRSRLMAAGVHLRRSFYGDGAPFRCEDGHFVRSHFEQMVDDWLWRHRLAHATEPNLPFDTLRRADFLVGDTYIEVWGVVGHDGYTERRRSKLADYRTAGYRVISLYPRDFGANLDRHLSVLLRP